MMLIKEMKQMFGRGKLF